MDFVSTKSLLFYSSLCLISPKQSGGDGSMETNRIERQLKFVQMAAMHAEDFKSRVAEHDRNNTFPFENVQAMKESGYTSMTVPEELGGGGCDPLDLVLAQERR